MATRLSRLFRLCLWVLPALVLTLLPAGRAATVWNGPLNSFTKDSGANPSLPANQDRIYANTWITRGGTQGIYNAAQEIRFTHYFSPTNTEWANGTLANYASLTYTNWNRWAKGVKPKSTVNRGCGRRGAFDRGGHLPVGAVHVVGGTGWRVFLRALHGAAAHAHLDIDQPHERLGLRRAGELCPDGQRERERWDGDQRGILRGHRVAGKGDGVAVQRDGKHHDGGTLPVDGGGHGGRSVRHVRAGNDQRGDPRGGDHECASGEW